MEDVLAPDVVMSTTTSALKVQELGEAIPNSAHRLVGMHFLQPVPVMKLVELVQTE